MRKDKGPAILLFTVLLAMPLVFPASSFEVIVDQHSDSFPRIGNPVLTALPNGSILAAFSVFNTSGEEGFGIYGKLSNDLQSWSDRFLIKAGTLDYQPSSCTLFVAQNKTFLIYDRYVSWVFQTHEYNCSIWMLESEDNGQTWVNDRRIDLESQNYTLGTYSVCITQNNTLIFPISWFVLPSWPRVEGSWTSGMLRSDDEGLSWYAAGTIPDCNRSSRNLDEPSVVQLSNGSLYCLMRSYIWDEPRHVCSVSNDLGLSWSEPRLVPEMVSIDTTPALANYEPNLTLAMWINRMAAVNYIPMPRTPLVLALSRDNCSTWQNVTVIDNPDGTEMNDMSFFILKNKIVLCYRRSNYYWAHFNEPNDNAIIEVLEMNKADFNHDGNINILDAILLSNNFNTSNTLTDLNYDGLTNLEDAMLFERNSLAIFISSPIGFP